MAKTSVQNSKTPVWVWVGLAAILFAALGVAVLVASPSSSDDITSGDVSASGAVLTPYTGQTPDTDVGKQSPVVRGTNFAGEPVTVGEPGEPQVLVFLAHWCPVCQREVPKIVEWANAGGDTSGVAVVGVATGIDRTRGNWPPGAWLREEGWPYQTLVDNPQSVTSEAFGLTGFPYFVAIDKDGKIVARVSGEVDGAGFAALIEAARTGAAAGVTGGESSTAAPQTPANQ